jgi:adenosylhomocysteine nucleosidase
MTTIGLWILQMIIATSPAQAGSVKHVVVVSGMTEEGQIAAGPNVISVLSGGSLTTLLENLNQLDPDEVSAVVSFGVAGALDPSLNVGDIVVATSLQNDAGDVFPADPAIVRAMVQGLENNYMTYKTGQVFGTTVPRYTGASKAQLWQQSGAISVDEESEGAAEWAAANGLPFGMMRSISDNQSFSLPPLATTAVNSDGTWNIQNIEAALEQDPGQVPSLLEMAWDAITSFSSLDTARAAVNLGKL